jgi:hypothetical protein
MDLVSPSSGLIFWQLFMGLSGLGFIFYIVYLVVKFLKMGIKYFNSGIQKNLESK